MATYIGPHVIPHAEGSHDPAKQYDNLSIVLDDATNASYISTKDVPVGKGILDKEYWLPLTAYSGEYSKLEDELKRKIAETNAEQTEALEAQKARVDNLIATTSPGEGELVDVRVGADGTTYPSAGTAVRSQIAKVNEDVKDISEYTNIFYFTDLTTRTIAGSLTISFPDASTIHLNGECIDPAGSNRRWCIGVMGGSDSPSAGTVRNSTSTYTGKFGFTREVTGGANPGFRLAYSAEDRGAGTAISAGSVIDIEDAYIQLAIYPGIYNDVTLKVCLSEGGLIGYVPHKLSAVDEVARAKVSDLEYVNNTLGYKVSNNLYADVTLAEIKAANTTGTWDGNAYTKDGVIFTVNDDMSVKVTSTSSFTATSFMYPYRTLAVGDEVYFNNDNPCEMRIFRSGTSKFVVRPGVSRYTKYTVDQAGSFRLTVSISRAADFDLRPPVLLIGSDKSDIDTRLSAIEYPVPDYYFADDYLTEKINEINDNMAEVGKHGETFAFITDIHWNQNNMKRSPALMKYIKRKTSLDNVICGGDILDNGSRALMRRTTLECLDAFYDPAVPFIMANGNHDTNANNQSDPTAVFDYDEEYALIYKRIGKYVTMPVDGSMMMIYDRPDTRTRFIVMDTKENDTITSEEYDAMAAYLNSMDDGWSAIVIGHWFFGTIDGVRKLNGVGDMVAAFCDAYNDRGSLYGRDFRNGKGTVRAIISGHTHYDATVKTPGGIPAFCTTGDNILRDNDEARFPRTPGTITEQAFDIVTIDYETGNIKTVRIGSGVNRFFDRGVWG